MLSHIRRIQKGTLIVVTAIIVVAFAFLYSDFDFARGAVGRQDCVVKVYDRCYRQKEVQKLATHFEVAMRLGMYDFATVLFGENRQDQDRTDFILSLIVLRKEARELGIEPAASEIKETIPNLPVFQQQFVDAEFVENNILGPSGFTDGDLAQLVKDYLSFQKLRRLVSAGVTAVPADTERRYIKANRRFTAKLVSFDRESYASSVEITEKEIEEYYDENAEDLKSEPKRGFDYVEFSRKSLADDATNEQKAKANLAFANAVNRAYADMAEDGANFEEVAQLYEGEQADFTMELHTLQPFPRSSPPEALAGDEAQLETLFGDTLQPGGVTVPIDTEDGGYRVFHYREFVEPKPLSLEEARDAIKEALVARKSNRAVNDAASEARAELTEALEAGKSFAEAAEAAGVDLRSLPEFSEQEPPAEVENAGLVVDAVKELGEGELSSVIERPGGKGYFLVYVDRIRLFENENRESDERSLAAETETELARTMFSAWFNQRLAESQSKRPTTTGPIQ